MDTRIELVNLLETLAEPTARRDKIIAKAKAGAYHDYKSESPCPKLDLISDLSAAGFSALVDRVKNGDFDESPDSDDLDQIRASLPGEDNRALRQVLGLE